MARCEGTTLKGDQCRREARPGSSYCSIHAEQGPPGRSADPMDWDVDTLVKTAVGFGLLAAIVLFRIKR